MKKMPVFGRCSAEFRLSETLRPFIIPNTTAAHFERRKVCGSREDPVSPVSPPAIFGAEDSAATASKNRRPRNGVCATPLGEVIPAEAGIPFFRVQNGEEQNCGLPGKNRDGIFLQNEPEKLFRISETPQESAKTNRKIAQKAEKC
jgi:hypothetical protein